MQIECIASSLLERFAECSLSSAKIMQTSVEYQACLNILPSAAYLLQRYKKYLLMQ